ncbi:hypothetical protein [Enterococcus innesii]|uniref:hypothetical protein n=1 Tax=Enterococcus innesii TaxID=2839759 RepID=UPI002DB5DA18|nr:hypothetical protein [Enterococcus innesii]MEB5953086.1 hypothetical protein [Enterococcus innesii]
MKNEQKLRYIKEAIKRMKALGIIDDTIQQFEQADLVSYSLRGGNYWLDNSFKQLVAEFEEKHDYLVYYAILSYTAIGKMLSLFYVSNREEEWSGDWKELNEGFQMSYVFNLDIPEYSEFGLIGFKPIFGGLIRTA